MSHVSYASKIERWIVLICDDDEAIRKILIEHLYAIGFRNFIEAKDGAEGYKYILDPLRRVDLVLCDWEMPRADGLTLLRALRSNRDKCETPFIMITSQQSQERMKISNAKKSKVNDYIIKPFRFETLQEKIMAVVKAEIEKRAAAS
jgi:DNA-binding response OmpR family regulator